MGGKNAHIKCQVGKRNCYLDRLLCLEVFVCWGVRCKISYDPSGYFLEKSVLDTAILARREVSCWAAENIPCGTEKH